MFIMRSIAILSFGVFGSQFFSGVFASEVEDGEGGSFVFLSQNVELKEDPKSCKKTEWKQACEEAKLMSFLASLQVINPVSVIALATKNKLDKTCQNVSKTMDRMQSYLKSCSLQPQQGAYSRLLKGVTTLHHKLCTKDSYRKSFMTFKNCYSQLQNDLESCNGPADWLETSDAPRVCKAYQEIADCYYIKSSVLCGNRAADVFKELVSAVVDSVLTVNCSSAAHLGSISKHLNDDLQGVQLLGDHKGLSPSSALSSALVAFCLLLLLLHV